MRFDPERVVALVDAWNDLRQDPSGSERRVADEIAGHFERAGLRVERVEAPPNGFPSWVLALVLTVCLGMTAGFGLTDVSIPVRIGLMGAILVTLLVTAGWVGRQACKAGPARGSHHIIGRPAREDRPPARVVLLARLGTPRATWREGGMLSLWGLFGLQSLVLCLPWFAPEARLNPDLGLTVLLGQWLTAIGMVLYPTWRASRPIPGENRIGRALLAELARTWPQRVGDRVETWFAATPNPRALATELAKRPGERPATLVIELAAPGVGDKLIIAARGPALRLAGKAARDLWIPHRATWRGAGLFLPTFSEFDLLGVSLRGSRSDGPINPALLAASAQLMTEIALRWAKQGRPPSQPESLARSSQNPG
jgi:hypothetical protein